MRSRSLPGTLSRQQRTISPGDQTERNRFFGNKTRRLIGSRGIPISSRVGLGAFRRRSLSKRTTSSISSRRMSAQSFWLFWTDVGVRTKFGRSFPFGERTQANNRIPVKPREASPGAVQTGFPSIVVETACAMMCHYNQSCREESQ
jgi:hypothetical protein